MLAPDEIESLVGRIAQRLRPRRVVMFGSYAKGTATARSDLDLLVIQDTDLPPARRTEAIDPILWSILVPVDVHVLTPEEVAELGREEHSFVRSVLATGRTVYEA